MGWLDTSNALGGMCIADQSLVTSGIVGDGSFYSYCGRSNPKDPSKGDFAPRLGFAWLRFADGKTVIRGGYGVFYDSAEGREIDGSADIYPYVSRGNYPQSIGQLTPLQTTDALFPVFSNPGPVTPRRQQLHRGDHLGEPERPVRAAVVARCATVDHEQHDCGAELRRQQGLEPADATQHRAGAAVHRGATERAGAQAVPELRGLHQQRLERLLELQRLEREARAPGPQRAGHARLHLGQEHRQQVRRGWHRRLGLQRLAGLPGQPRPEAGSRLVRLRRGSPSRRQLRLQPPVRPGREVRQRRRRASRMQLSAAGR